MGLRGGSTKVHVLPHHGNDRCGGISSARVFAALDVSARSRGRGRERADLAGWLGRSRLHARALGFRRADGDCDMTTEVASLSAFDATMERALERGLLSESDLDKITDTIARGHKTEQNYIDEWTARIAGAEDDDSDEDSEDSDDDDSIDAERSTFEHVFCGAELKLNRISLHLDTTDVRALLAVKRCMITELGNITELEQDDTGATEDARELWHRLCAEKAKLVGLEHQWSAWRSLVHKCEKWNVEWNAEDDDRHPSLKKDLADDPSTYFMLLEAGRASKTEGYAAGQRDETFVNPTSSQFEHLLVMQGMRDLAEWAILHNESCVLRQLFNLGDKSEAHDVRLKMLEKMAPDMLGTSFYRADDMEQDEEDREREEELRIEMQMQLALLVCLLAALTPLIFDNYDNFATWRFSSRAMHLILATGYLAKPGRIVAFEEDGSPQQPFDMTEESAPEAVLVVDALALLVWWPQFRAHVQHMKALRKYQAAVRPNDRFFQHAHLGDLRDSMRAAAKFYAARPANARNLAPAEQRVEEVPAVAAVIRRAGVDIDDL